MNILLTGGTGYIGSHVAVTLTKARHHVILFDNFSNSHKGVLESLNKILNKPLSFVEGDIRNTELLSTTLREWRIDAVIHLAGLKAVGQSVTDPIDYYSNNVQGSISLLQAMKAENVKTLIFSSSATVYGAPQYLPLDERHPLKPINPYGRTKVHIEEMLRDFARSDSTLKVICLRYFNPIGAHESGLIGEQPLGLPNNLMPYLVMVANGELPHLNIYGCDYPTPDGTGIRDYIHVIDLAEGHLAALNFSKNHFGWDVFNLGTGIKTSVYELISSFETATGRHIPFEKIERRDGDIAACYTGVDKAKNILNWQASRSLNNMCLSSWVFQKTEK